MYSFHIFRNKWTQLEALDCLSTSSKSQGGYFVHAASAEPTIPDHQSLDSGLRVDAKLHVQAGCDATLPKLLGACIGHV